MDIKLVDESVLVNQINGGRNVSLSLLEAYRGIAAENRVYEGLLIDIKLRAESQVDG